MNTIEKMNPLFKKGQAGDSKDFIIFILEQIHKELKSKISKNYNVIQPLNQYDRDNAFNYFINDFTKDCSIISDAFFGFTETTNECLNCKKCYNSQNLKNPICYNYGIFNCLIFPLEEVKNYKNKMNNMDYMNKMNNMIYMNNMGYMNNMNNMGYMNNMSNIAQCNSVTLDDCFIFNQKTDLFTGENRNYCNICKQLYDSYYTSKIYSCPNNLILILNRGKNNMYNIKIYFEEAIDITQYVVINDGNKWIYNLYGVITHIGESGPNAHFVASCKSPVDSQWYRYNDAFVNPISNVQNEIINFGTPYILFYQKQN
jgi:ubiquitin C-terminal hydrolase